MAMATVTAATRITTITTATTATNEHRWNARRVNSQMRSLYTLGELVSGKQ